MSILLLQPWRSLSKIEIFESFENFERNAVYISFTCLPLQILQISIRMCNFQLVKLLAHQKQYNFSIFQNLSCTIASSIHLMTWGYCLTFYLSFSKIFLFIRYIPATAAGELQASKQEFESAAVPLITGCLTPREIQYRYIISRLKELIPIPLKQAYGSPGCALPVPAQLV